MNINHVEIEGLDNLNSLLRIMPESIKSKVSSSLSQCLADLRQKSASQAPYDLGALEGSAKSGVTNTLTGIEGYVGFFEPYATIQHENMDFHHEEGRNAKYLQNPLQDNISQYVKEIEKAILRAVSL